MSFKNTLVIAALAFGAGYYLSEYRHAQDLVPALVDAQVNAEPQEAAAQALPYAANQSPVLVQSSAAVPVIHAETAAPAELPPLERARQLIANNAFPAAISLLNEIVQKNPADTDALLLLARVLEKQGKHEDAVTTWFRYLAIEVDAKKAEEAIAYLSRYLIRLVNNPGIFGASREWLMVQLNDLIKLTPDNGELHLQLADMHAKADDQEQAQYHALMAANQDETRTRAEEFIAHMADKTIVEQPMDEGVSIALVRIGNQFLVPISVEGRKARLLLDTGASISGLTSSFINRNYSIVKAQKPIQLNTASGTVDSYLFVVDSLQLAGLTFNKHMLARLPMDNQDAFDGLLGVDVLGRFDFVIDQEKAVLRLRKRQ